MFDKQTTAWLLTVGKHPFRLRETINTLYTQYCRGAIKADHRQKYQARIKIFTSHADVQNKFDHQTRHPQAPRWLPTLCNIQHGQHNHARAT